MNEKISNFFPIFTGLCHNILHYNLVNFLRAVYRLIRHTVVFTLLSFNKRSRLLNSYQHGATWSEHIK